MRGKGSLPQTASALQFSRMAKSNQVRRNAADTLPKSWFARDVVRRPLCFRIFTLLAPPPQAMEREVIARLGHAPRCT